MKMKNDFCTEFEKKVLSQLESITGGIEHFRFGVAVSGGADSISLLTSLNSIFCKRGLPLFVISVNHNIRTAEETCGDAAYVELFCKELNNSGGKVAFTLKEIEPGLVAKTAENRGEGIEEAARFLRYSAFEDFIKENQLDYLCLAHNQNDQEETLLMRFLQGSSVDAGSGIAVCRGKYIRPLMQIERSEIETYLNLKNIKWRTDSTNSDTKYLRNRIRHELMPFLNEKFPGWQNAVLNGGKKALIDGNFINEQVDKALKFADENSISLTDFSALPEALQSRIVIRLINNCGCGERVPYVFVQDILNAVHTSRNFKKQFADIQVSVEKNILLFKKVCKTQTDLVFFDIIEESGVKVYPFGQVVVEKYKDFISLTCNGVSILLNLDFPFCIRNMQIDDSIESKNGTLKKVADVFADWKVNEENRSRIPLIQELNTEKQSLICIFGEPFGFYNWIVRK